MHCSTKFNNPNPKLKTCLLTRLTPSPPSLCHVRCEGSLHRPLPSECGRLPRRPGHGCELCHWLPAGGGHPRGAGGGSDRRWRHPPLPQSGAAEWAGHGRRPQEAAAGLRGSCCSISQTWLGGLLWLFDFTTFDPIFLGVFNKVIHLLWGDLYFTSNEMTTINEISRKAKTLMPHANRTI